MRSGMIDLQLIANANAESLERLKNVEPGNKKRDCYDRQSLF
jgi:hypothetical protein